MTDRGINFLFFTTAFAVIAFFLMKNDYREAVFYALFFAFCYTMHLISDRPKKEK